MENPLNNITFTLLDEDYTGPAPTPASEALPEWYKDMNSYLPEHVINHNDIRPIKATIKKCMPVFDSITAGYMLYTPADVIISTVNGSPYFEWNASYDVLEFHLKEQAHAHPKVNMHSVPKWVNYWAVKTPKGFSCLFTPPLNSDESPFTVLPAIVDTDQLTSPINLPFVLKDPNFNGMIPKGTPMCQIIPFKRDEWEMKIGDKDDREKSISQLWSLGKLPMFNYRKSWWQKKSYK